MTLARFRARSPFQACKNEGLFESSVISLTPNTILLETALFCFRHLIICFLYLQLREVLFWMFLYKDQSYNCIINLGLCVFLKFSVLALIFEYFQFIKNMQNLIPRILGLEDTFPELGSLKFPESSSLEVVQNIFTTLNASPHPTQNQSQRLEPSFKRKSIGKYTFAGHCFFACVSVFFHEYILA